MTGAAVALERNHSQSQVCLLSSTMLHYHSADHSDPVLKMTSNSAIRTNETSSAFRGFPPTDASTWKCLGWTFFILKNNKISSEVLLIIFSSVITNRSPSPSLSLDGSRAVLDFGSEISRGREPALYWWRERHLTLWAIKTQSFLIKILNAWNQITFGERLWLRPRNGFLWEKTFSGRREIVNRQSSKEFAFFLWDRIRKMGAYLAFWHGYFFFSATLFWALLGRGGEAWRQSGTDRSWLHSQAKKGRTQARSTN